MPLNIFRSARLRKEEQRRANMYKALIHYEARLGGEIFGPVSKGMRREFFCLDEHTWVWHEEWDDTSGKHQVLTTRYDVRPGGIVKSQGNNVYQAIGEQEAMNLYRAIQIYGEKIVPELQRLAAQAS